jgi:DNA-binding LacI/PurR family transcriptional regulator/DNA-binding transcriptional regulator YhcF (GntR family)
MGDNNCRGNQALQDLRQVLIGQARNAGMTKGSGLLSIRKIARVHGVSKALAEKAVRSLVSDGICFAEQGKGVFLAVEDPRLPDMEPAASTICTVFGYMEYPQSDLSFFRQIFEGAQEVICIQRHNAAKLYNWRSKSSFTKNLELERFTAVVDGFLTLGIYSDEDCLRLRKTELPLVILDYDTEALGIDCVVMDNFATMKEMTARLIKRGAKNIFYLHSHRDKPDDPSLQDRWNGAKSAVAASGSPTNILQLELPVGQDRSARGFFVDLAEQLRSTSSNSTLIFEDDGQLGCTLSALSQLDLEPGRNFMIGYVGGKSPDKTVARYPALVIGYDFAELGRTGIELLARRMRTGPGRAMKSILSGKIFDHVSDQEERTC